MEATGYDHRAIEEQVRALWEQHDIYRFDRDAAGPVFSVDTPPPYASAGNLHVGHAMSYSQPDFVVRYRRMRGERIFYPMGFDDNGLPTERYVEQTHGVRAADLPRAEFVALCLAETGRIAAGYEQLWRRLGLSVDWSLRYSTIDARCRRTAQASFLRLYARGHIARACDPILWCPECRTALAQADVDDLDRSGTLYRVAFPDSHAPDRDHHTPGDRAPLVVATTRPELLPACVALYCHPDDGRYRSYVGTSARVPLAGHEVPVHADTGVDPEFGTGLVMVCTFGDGEDVARWRRDRLELRLVVTADGRLNEAAGDLARMPLRDARKEALARLSAAGALRGQSATRQAVGLHERCGTPVEFQVRPQWFLRLRDQREVLRRRAGELTWVPPYMRRRLDDWIDGLRWDWNLSRQRHYGVPFPAWFCRSCGAPVLAAEESLPVDPLSDAPPARCPWCGSGELDPDSDVMDTWLTSSLSPQINAGWPPPAVAETGGSAPGAPETPGTPGGGRVPDPQLAPMSLRIQGYEIIRTWLFYTVAQSQLHFDRVPWHTVMISGLGLNEQGRKISKRELDRATAADGYNRYVPDHAIDRYGADALRLWATKARVGSDLRFHETDVRAGRKLAVKLFNVGRFLDRHLDSSPAGDAVPVDRMTAVDRWLLSHLAETLDEVTAHLEAYEVSQAHQAAARFFWSVFCDRYLEMIKGRFGDLARPEPAGDAVQSGGAAERASARTALRVAFRAVLGMFAPFAPFVTEHLYQRWYRPHEGTVSLHLTGWPAAPAAWRTDRSDIDQLATVLDHVRARRSRLRLGSGAPVAALVLQPASREAFLLAREIAEPLRVAARARQLRYADAAHPSGVPDLTVDVVPEV